MTNILFIIVHIAFTTPSVYSWAMRASHINIVPKLTNDVTIRCFYDGNNNGRNVIQIMSRIRILKLDHNGSWRTFAMKVRDNNNQVISGPNVYVTGHIGNPKESFLDVTWPVALNDTVGTYMCEVNGFDFRYDIVVINNTFTELTATTVTLKELLNIVITMGSHEAKMQERLRKVEKNQATAEKFYSNLTGDMAALQSVQKDCNTSVNQSLHFLDNYLSAIDREIQAKIEDNFFEVRQWPVGPAAFPASTAGCPENDVDVWQLGFVRINLNQSPINPRVSPVNHLDTPVFDQVGSQRFFYMRFCTKTSSTGGADWPKGSYCLNAGMFNACPSSFVSSTLSISRHAGRTLSVTNENGPYFQTTRRTMTTAFCCRSDGAADNPIRLPINSPFFMYRFNGQCQAVRKANVTDEWLEIASTGVSASYSNQTFHPDNDSLPTRLHICYYQKMAR